jgi:hypothetical protein
MYCDEMVKQIMKVAGRDTSFVFDLVEWEAHNWPCKRYRDQRK